MMMSEKSKQHVDSCRFCWMCHHICPVGNATGHERSTPRARALGISMVNRGAIELSEIMDNIYECAGCGACVHDCVTGWDPVMFTKEVRLQAALEGKLPDYIMTLVTNCLEKGNAYGKTALCDTLTSAIKKHSDKKDTLLLLGVDARYMACKEALKAIKVLEKAGVDFTLHHQNARSVADSTLCRNRLGHRITDAVTKITQIHTGRKRNRCARTVHNLCKVQKHSIPSLQSCLDII